MNLKLDRPKNEQKPSKGLQQAIGAIKPEKHRTCVAIDKELYKKARHAAAERFVSVGSLIEEGLKLYLHCKLDDNL